MPTYQYRCTDCGHELEEFQSFTDDALTVCPVCAGRLRKVFNAVGVVFKGSGFYRNDSRQGGSSSSDSSGSESASSGSTSSESKSSDSKGSESKGSESKSSESKTTSDSASKSTASTSPAAAS